MPPGPQNGLESPIEALNGLDPVQEALLNEVCILVDENDKSIGTATKKECHLLKDGKSEWLGSS